MYIFCKHALTCESDRFYGHFNFEQENLFEMMGLCNEVGSDEFKMTPCGGLEGRGEGGNRVPVVY